MTGAPSTLISPSVQTEPSSQTKRESLDPKKCLVVYSGGLDSTVLLYDAIVAFSHTEREPTVSAISFDYGQRHVKELDAAQEITGDLSVVHDTLDVSFLGHFLSSCLTTVPGNPQDFGGEVETRYLEDIPKGHYEDEVMKITAVPNRNMIMISIATGIAISRGIGQVAIGCHSGDHAIYPDCRESFLSYMRRSLHSCWYEPIELCAPFITVDKAQLVKIGYDFQVPFEKTWSCYEGGEIHCGECGTCVERREAFVEASIEDPTVYATSK